MTCLSGDGIQSNGTDGDTSGVSGGNVGENMTSTLIEA